MLILLSQVSSFLHEALPLIVGAVVALGMALLHRKNQLLEKAHVELAQKVDDVANAKAEENISTLEAKVASDDEKRLEAEKALDSASAPPCERGGR